MAFDKKHYKAVKDFVHTSLFEHAAPPMAMYDMIDWSCEQENYEAAKAVKEELTLYLEMYDNTKDFPMLTYVDFDREEYRMEIEKLRSLVQCR